MRYAKIEDGGCSYLCIDCTTSPNTPATMAQQMQSHPLLADCAGLMLAYPSNQAAVRLYSFSCDGRQADSIDAVCGFGAFVYAHGLVQNTSLLIEAGKVILSADLQLTGDRVSRVNVNVGTPILYPPVGMPMTFPDTVYDVTRLSVAGEPHCVTFVHELSQSLFQEIGPQIQSRLSSPTHTNVEFAKVNRRDDVTIRMIRQEAGEGRCSYTGACAVAVAGCLTGRTQRKVKVHMSGGTIEVRYSERGDGEVAFAGSATELLSGELEESTARVLS